MSNIHVVELISIGSIRKNIENYLKDLIKKLKVIDNVIVYIVNNHDYTREVLGLKTLNEYGIKYSEKPIKLIYVEDIDQVIISISKDVIHLKDYEIYINLARELLLYNILKDPMYIDTWYIKDEYLNDKYARFLSIAMLNRLVDKILCLENFKDYLLKVFDKELFRNIINESEIDEKFKAIKLLYLDLPLSFELCNEITLGKSLYDDCIKGINNDFLTKYDDFRSFIRNNFSLEYALNYLHTIF